jgi:hypothetical protein
MEQLMDLPFMVQEVITLEDVLRSEIPLKDKQWVIWNNCELSLDENKKLALQLAWMVLPIYEKKYPNDNLVKECLEATELFLKGEITINELRKKRYAIADAADAAYAADASAYAADASAYASAYAADASADASAYASAYAAAAAYAADAIRNDLTYKEKYLQILINFVK